MHIANQNGNITSYLKDYHGNIVGTTTAAGVMVQEINNRMDYDAFGNQWIGDTPDPLGYCGEYYDNESGLIYLRNRYYNSTTGRFINEDPIKDGTNWYSYCGNNPVMFIDPTGKNMEATGIDVILKYGFKIAKKVSDAANRASKNAMVKAYNWGYITEDGMIDAHNNRADAMRHFQWNAVMAREIGHDVAKYVGDVYEMNEVEDKGHFIGEENRVASMWLGQEELMDLWNNSVGRTFAKDLDFAKYNYDELFYYAENNNYLITDASNAFNYYGIPEHCIDFNDYTVEVNYNIDKETITIIKEGSPYMELRVGIEAWW